MAESDAPIDATSTSELRAPSTKKAIGKVEGFFRFLWYIISHCDHHLTVACEGLASYVNKYKAIFILVPFFLAIILAHGLSRISFITENEFLFVPLASLSITDRAKIERFFPTNYSAFVPGHESQFRKQVELIVVAQTEDGSVMKPEIWKEISDVNDFLVNKLVVIHGQKRIRFEDVCAKFNGQCLKNGFLSLKSNMDNIRQGKLILEYPLMQDPVTFNSFLLPMHLGGVLLEPIVNSTSFEVKDARALRLVFVLDSSDEERIKMSSAWETGALKVVHENISAAHAVITAVNSESIAKELVVNIHSALHYIHYAIGLVVAYTVANTHHPLDSSKIKIWIGLLGLINTLIATAGAWGLLSYIGYDWQAINLASVFLLLGVGLDDTFVMLSAWRHTNSNEGVEERLRECYKEAAVSITITSLTNVLSFGIGAFFPDFKCVEIFCMYTGVGIIFIYLYNLTFFGACLAFFGVLEKRDLHGFLFCFPKRKVDLSKITSQNLGQPLDLLKGPATFSEYIFENLLPDLLVKAHVKAIIITVFVAYWGLCAYWISMTREGFERRKLALDDSYVVKFYDYEDAYFRINPFRFQIVITDPIDYADPRVRQSVIDLLDKFKSSPFVSNIPDFEENWLNEFILFTRKKSEMLKLNETELLAPENFMRELVEFLPYAAATPIVHNLVLSEDKKSIVASRFFLQSTRMPGAVEDMAMVKALRLIADEAPFKTLIFNPYFTFIDLFIGVRPSILMCLISGTLIMLFVAVMLIPNPSASIWVIFTIISIEAGVLGFMYAWGINLDVISMICLIMCIGFSVDFSAHISYHFLASDAKSADEKIRSSLKAFGTPIVQGACSTLLAIVVLSFLPSYILQSFAKMLFLVVILGMIHGLLLLPVLLSMFTSWDNLVAFGQRFRRKKDPLDNVANVDIAAVAAKGDH